MIPRRTIGRSLKKALSQPGYAFRAFGQRFRSYLTYRLFNGRSAYPETVSILLTYQCNLRCKMCGQWGETGSSKFYSPEVLRQILSLEELKALVDELASFGPTITLFGGEPLMYKHWNELLAYIKSKGLRCNMISNCVLLEDHAEALVDLGLDEIIFSLDGPEALHDEIRSRKGTFQKATSGIMAVNRIKKERGTNKPVINVNSTIFDFNTFNLSEMAEIADRLEAKTITFHHLIFMSRGTYQEHNCIFRELFGVESFDWAGFVEEELPRIDPDALIEEMNKVKKQKDLKTAVTFYPNFIEEEIREYYTSFRFLPTTYRHRCLSPWMVAYVFPDGSVRPCLSMNLSVGNMKEASFSEIWNGESYRRFRSEVKQRGFFPVCSRCTEFCRF
jgi:MoaA/NifB/PqqE/SkfB family radical SAM enzyme